MEISTFITTQEITLALQLIVAINLGMLLGAERKMAGKTAGMRTHALVAMASTLYTSLAVFYSVSPEGFGISDPFRVIAGVVTGIGFIGAGIIMFRDATPKGITTAAGLWVTSAIGVSIGLGYYFIAVIGTLLVLFIFRVLWVVERQMQHAWSDDTEVIADKE
jgi:putative Mg2+ transporter-C (MgtC) family protein